MPPAVVAYKVVLRKLATTVTAMQTKDTAMIIILYKHKH